LCLDQTLEKDDKDMLKVAKLAILDAKKCVALERKWAKGYVRWATALMVEHDFVAAVKYESIFDKAFLPFNFM